MKLAHTIAAMARPEDFLLDVAMSGDQDAIELLITALKELDGETCALTVLDTIVEADTAATSTPRRRRPGCSAPCAIRITLPIDLIENQKGARTTPKKTKAKAADKPADPSCVGWHP